MQHLMLQHRTLSNGTEVELPIRYVNSRWLAATFLADLDRFDFPALDRVEPFVAMHDERAGRPSSDEDEIGVNEGAQLIHIAMAQGIAPFAFEILDQPPVLLVSQKGVLLSPASL